MGAPVADFSTMTLLLLFFLTPGVLCHESSCDQCKETHPVNTLLLGGGTETEVESTSMEVISSTGVCTPKLPPIPVPRWGARAVLIHNKLLYCGGYNRDAMRSCHSYQLGEGETVWREEPQMVQTRGYFSLSLVGDTVYAVGGAGDGHGHVEDGKDTVESYTEEGGWTIEGKMRMDKWRAGHCSVVRETEIIILGGGYGSQSPSRSVQSINTYKPEGWKSMKSMKTARVGHECIVWTFDKTGIVIAGGYGDPVDSGKLASVEFYSYSEDTWIQLGSLLTPRAFHSVTAVSGMLVVSGGLHSDYLTTVEYYNGTRSEWEVLTNLTEGRMQPSGVSVPA